MSKKKTRWIVVVGRRWFQKVSGNTYHSSEVWVNGELIEKVNYEYGYREQFIQSAYEILIRKGILKKASLNQSLWEYCADNEIMFNSFVFDIENKKDL